jgi:hypothetical protein
MVPPCREYWHGLKISGNDRHEKSGNCYPHLHTQLGEDRRDRFHNWQVIWQHPELQYLALSMKVVAPGR